MHRGVSSDRQSGYDTFVKGNAGPRLITYIAAPFLKQADIAAADDMHTAAGIHGHVDCHSPTGDPHPAAIVDSGDAGITAGHNVQAVARSHRKIGACLSAVDGDDRSIRFEIFSVMLQSGNDMLCFVLDNVGDKSGSGG